MHQSQKHSFDWHQSNSWATIPPHFSPLHVKKYVLARSFMRKPKLVSRCRGGGSDFQQVRKTPHSSGFQSFCLTPWECGGARLKHFHSTITLGLCIPFTKERIWILAVLLLGLEEQTYIHSHTKAARAKIKRQHRG